MFYTVVWLYNNLENQTQYAYMSYLVQPVFSYVFNVV